MVFFLSTENVSTRRSRSQSGPSLRRHRMLSSDPALARPQSEYSLPPSPAHSDTTWDTTSNKTTQPSKRESDSSNHDASDKVDRSVLREKRRQRQKYHAERNKLASSADKPSQALGSTSSSHSSSQSTFVDSNRTSVCAPQSWRRFSADSDQGSSMDYNESSAHTALSVRPCSAESSRSTSDSNNSSVYKLQSVRPCSVEDHKPTNNIMHEVNKYNTPSNSKGSHAGAHSSVLKIDHVDSVSLQSFSPTSTLERQRSRDNGTKKSERDSISSSDATQIVHYHLTIQNCDGMNIYVNNPAGTDFSPGSVQVDEAGLLKTLNWVQGPKENTASSSNDVQSSNSNVIDQSPNHSAFPETSTVSVNNQARWKFTRSRSYRDNTRKVTSVDKQKKYGDSNATCKGPRGSASVFPWHDKVGESEFVNDTNNGRYQTSLSPLTPCSVSTASQTSQAQSSQSMQTENAVQSATVTRCSITSQTDMGGGHWTNKSPPRSNTQQTVPKIRPIAHVSPHRRSTRSTSQGQQSRIAHQVHSRSFLPSNVQTPSSDIVSDRQLPQMEHAELAEAISLSRNSSNSLSSLTTEGLLEADAGVDISSSDPDTTLSDDSFSSSDSASSVLDRSHIDPIRLSRRDQSAMIQSGRPNTRATDQNDIATQETRGSKGCMMYYFS